MKNSLLTKSAFLISVILFTLLVIFTILTRQSSYIVLSIAVLIVPMLFAKRDSPVFKVTSTLMFILALIFIFTYYGRMLSVMPKFHFAVIVAGLLLPIALTQTKLTTYIFLIIILFYSAYSYGMMGDERASFVNVYNKGAGRLYFPFMIILLFLLALSILVHRRLFKNADNTVTISCNLYKYFWSFNIVYLMFILYGMGNGIPFHDITNPQTVVNVTHMTLFVFVLIQLFKSEKDIEQFMKVFLGCMVVKSLYGVFRFIFMEGDPANHYRNKAGATDVVITYFDAGQGYIGCIAVYYSLWMLMKSGSMLSEKKKIFYWLVIIVGVFNMIFSYRRTIWLGMLLVIIWLGQYLSGKQRLAMGILVVMMFSVIFGTLVKKRFGGTGDTFIENIAPDLVGKKTGQIEVVEGRFNELYLAWKTVEKNMLFGVGPWGSFDTDFTTKGHYVEANFTHSGLMYILLKMGFVGLISFVAILLAYVKFWLKERNREWQSVSLRALWEAAFAGFIFYIPSLLFAPMILQSRDLFLLGITLALPYVAVHFDREKVQLHSPHE